MRGSPQPTRPADHVIRYPDRFLAILDAAVRVAADGEHLVTLGTVPDRPATGYGYIRRGDRLEQLGEVGVYRARGFTEKPDRNLAAQFISAGEHLWNSGMFVWRVDTLLNAIARHMPDLHAALREIEPHLGRPDWGEAVARQRGSHVQFVHAGKTIKPGTFSEMLRKAG